MTRAASVEKGSLQTIVTIRGLRRLASFAMSMAAPVVRRQRAKARHKQCGYGLISYQLRNGLVAIHDAVDISDVRARHLVDQDAHQRQRASIRMERSVRALCVSRWISRVDREHAHVCFLAAPIESSLAHAIPRGRLSEPWVTDLPTVGRQVSGRLVATTATAEHVQTRHLGSLGQHGNKEGRTFAPPGSKRSPARTGKYGTYSHSKYKRTCCSESSSRIERLCLGDSATSKTLA
jgi:hypothetical protein